MLFKHDIVWFVYEIILKVDPNLVCELTVRELVCQVTDTLTGKRH